MNAEIRGHAPELTRPPRDGTVAQTTLAAMMVRLLRALWAARRWWLAPAIVFAVGLGTLWLGLPDGGLGRYLYGPR